MRPSNLNVYDRIDVVSIREMEYTQPNRHSLETPVNGGAVKMKFSAR